MDFARGSDLPYETSACNERRARGLIAIVENDECNAKRKFARVVAARTRRVLEYGNIKDATIARKLILELPLVLLPVAAAPLHVTRNTQHHTHHFINLMLLLLYS